MNGRTLVPMFRSPCLRVRRPILVLSRELSIEGKDRRCERSAYFLHSCCSHYPSEQTTSTSQQIRLVPEPAPLVRPLCLSVGSTMRPVGEPPPLKSALAPPCISAALSLAHPVSSLLWSAAMARALAR